MTPNILLILINGLGWCDLGGYGSMIYETPHIDRLCVQGMPFTDAYKLIEFFEERRLELYNLTNDIGETYNLAVEHPHILAHVHALLADWRAQTEASVPLPNVSYQPR